MGGEIMEDGKKIIDTFEAASAAFDSCLMTRETMAEMSAARWNLEHFVEKYHGSVFVRKGKAYHWDMDGGLVISDAISLED